MATALVTGGAGYIGSHTCVELMDAGWDVVVVDNLSNSSKVALDRVRELAPGNLWFHELDLLDGPGLDRVFTDHQVDAVIHFAGLKAVGESVEEPLRYYENNLSATVSLLKAMGRHGVRDLVFSSSCTVYGSPQVIPVDESCAIGPASPYGRTKAFIEDLLRDVAASEAQWRIILLRYFNPVGAHPSGRIGEDPLGIPNNLMPFVMQVAVGRRERLTVHGGDYATPDGTCVRDYIHVVDLAEGHVAALRALVRVDGCVAVNLGTGEGRSVRQVVAAASEAVGGPIPFTVGQRRPGDVPAIWADPALAASLLDWKAFRSLAEMCVDHWRWQSTNPHGFGGVGGGTLLPADHP
ncbi:MAG: UDP-glucose 4-epimerase GalE [Acidimicrobiales bacterium]